MAHLEPALHPTSQVGREEIEEWLQADVNEPIVEEMTDEAIVSSLRAPARNIPPEQESDEEEEEKERVTWKETHEGLAKSVFFVQGSDHYSSSEVMVVHILMDTFLTKKAKSCG